MTEVVTTVVVDTRLVVEITVVVVIRGAELLVKLVVELVVGVLEEVVEEVLDEVLLEAGLPEEPLTEATSYMSRYPPPPQYSRGAPLQAVLHWANEF